jgi:hypothetical protein
MPRATLPAFLKNAMTLEVMITSHTEDGLWEHIKKLYKFFEDHKDDYKSALSQSQDYYFSDENIYAKYTDKKKIKRRIFDFYEVIGSGQLENYGKCIGFYTDLLLFNRAFKWDEDVKKQEEYWEMVNEYEPWSAFMRTTEEDIKKLEESHYWKRVQEIEEATKKWEDENTELVDHQKNHFSKSRWEEILERDKNRKSTEEQDFYIKRNWNIMPSNCCFCDEENKKAEEKKRKEQEWIALQENVIEVKQDLKSVKNDVGEIKADVKEIKEQLKKLENKPAIEHYCEDCKYKTTSSGSWDYHINYDVEHKRKLKLKLWYCKACEVQSRTQVEYDNHLGTSKHKNKVEGNSEFVCEKCDYKTLLRQHWNQHCSTKKHKELNP